MPKFEVNEVIDSPVAEVFGFVTNLENDLQWISTAAEREKLTEGSIDKGTQFRLVERFMGRRMEFTVEVVEFVSGERMASRSVSGPFDVEVNATFQAADGGTQITIAGEAAAGLGGIFGKLADPLVARGYQRQMKANLGTLKDLLESQE